MSQLKTGAIPFAGRLANLVASSSLALSAIAGGLIVSGGEAKAVTKCFDFFPVANLVNPCVDGDWTNNYGSFSAPGQAGLVDLSDTVVSPDQAQVDIDFDPVTPSGTSGFYYYDISTADHKINQASFQGLSGAIGADWKADKYLYASPVIIPPGFDPAIDLAPSGWFKQLSIDELTSTDTASFSELSKVYVLDTWQTTTVGIDNLINVYNTPGPLPALGAGAAFGFSRKLRGRIKSSKTA